MKGYVDCRNEKLDQDIFSKIGLTMQSFYEKNQQLSPSIIANIMQAIQEYDYRVSILVSGVDASGPHIFRVDEPGRIESYDSIGHCSVGSGELHSISTFIANDYDPDKDLNHIVAMVYEAKRRSEKAQGVGEETDICIVSSKGITNLDSNTISKLNELYNKRLEQEKESVRELEQLISKLDITI